MLTKGYNQGKSISFSSLLILFLAIYIFIFSLLSYGIDYGSIALVSLIAFAFILSSLCFCIVCLFIGRNISWHFRFEEQGYLLLMAIANLGSLYLLIFFLKKEDYIGIFISLVAFVLFTALLTLKLTKSVVLGTIAGIICLVCALLVDVSFFTILLLNLID